MDKKRTKEFLNLFKDLQFSDIIGLANILQVPEKEDFEEFVIDLMEAFNSQNRTIRREILQLAKDIVKDNKVLVSEKEAENFKNQRKASEN